MVRDLPPVSGSIIWARQIDRQLTAYLRRVEDVLGELHPFETEFVRPTFVNVLKACENVTLFVLLVVMKDLTIFQHLTKVTRVLEVFCGIYFMTLSVYCLFYCIFVNFHPIHTFLYIFIYFNLMLFFYSLFSKFLTKFNSLVKCLFYFSGKGWENHIEGQKLKEDGDSFRMKLSTLEIFDEWARKVQQRNLGVSGRIFAIESHRSRTGRGTVHKLRVNFLPEIITLSKEVLFLFKTFIIEHLINVLFNIYSIYSQIRVGNIAGCKKRLSWLYQPTVASI